MGGVPMWGVRAASPLGERPGAGHHVGKLTKLASALLGWARIISSVGYSLRTSSLKEQPQTQHATPSNVFYTGKSSEKLNVLLFRALLFFHAGYI